MSLYSHPAGLFLFFLNREAQRAVNIQLDQSQVNSFLRNIATGTNAPLYTNYSNLFESEYFSDSGGILASLIRAGSLEVIGERPSFDEFLTSRIERYYFDADRYPMYFSSLPNTPVHPTKYLSGTTDFIQSQIRGIDNRTKNIGDLSLESSDETRILQRISILSRSARERDGKAITLSLFRGELDKQEDVGAAARLLSTVYIRHYQNSFNLNIPVGVPGMAYFDSLAQPSNEIDVTVASALFSKLGITDVLSHFTQEFDDTFPYLRGAPEHLQFIREFYTFLKVIDNLLGSGSTIHAVRHAAFDRLKSVDTLRKRNIDRLENQLLPFMLEQMSELVFLLKKDSSYQMAYQNTLYGEDGLMQNILIVTATDIETKMLLEVSSKVLSPQKATIFSENNYVYRELGVLGRQRIFSVQSEAGSLGASGSQATISDAIDRLSPSCVILAGIAFGAKEDKEKMGDILISRQLFEYERQRISEGGNTFRGEITEASPKPLSVFRAAKATWPGVTVHVGTLLSGEKLVDSGEYRNELLAICPGAIGGEMEGSGLRGVCQRKNVDWIVVKSIVDWGVGKTKSHQAEGANNTFDFLFFALSEVGF